MGCGVLEYAASPDGPWTAVEAATELFDMARTSQGAPSFFWLSLILATNRFISAEGLAGLALPT